MLIRAIKNIKKEEEKTLKKKCDFKEVKKKKNKVLPQMNKQFFG